MKLEIIRRAGEIVAQNTGEGTYCTLALLDAEGYPTASTITASQSDGIRWLTFGTGLGSNKAKRVERCGRASVCFNRGGDHNITLVGKIEIVTDATIKREMWYGALAHHFSGPDAPGYCVLRFTTERYNLFVEWQPEVAGTL